MKVRLTVFALLLALLTLAIWPAAAQEAADSVTPQDLAAPDGQFVEINGAQIYYIERGPADGPPVLLLHGFLGSTLNWEHVIDVLAEAGFRTVAFDRPPFGLSDKNIELDYSTNAQGDITVSLMDALGMERAVLVGHSAGGAVIANVAVRYPRRVEKLVFVAGAVGITPAHMGMEGDEPAPAGGPFTFLGDLDPNSPFAQAAVRIFVVDLGRNLLSASFYDPSKIPADEFERNAMYLELEGWEAGLLAFTRDADDPASQLDLETLRDITVPVLLIWGEEDAVVPVSVGERLRGLFPDVTWIAYPRVGHIPQIENTEQFNADLLAFLEA